MGYVVAAIIVMAWAASVRRFQRMIIVSVWLMMLIIPASAQITSDHATKSNDSAVAGLLISIDKTKQRMTVSLNGMKKYDWPVSTGRAGYSTPSGTYTATSMNEIWYSKEWDNSPMPHSVFFIKDGHAIHGSYEVKTLGKPVSHGCVRISLENAAKLYALVKESGLKNTKIVLTGVTPGGEYKITQSARREAGSGWQTQSNNYNQRRQDFSGTALVGGSDYPYGSPTPYDTSRVY